MPGVPRSRGCTSCKTRRIKCDENWPTCTPCAQRKYDCPGPSSLVKFVRDGDHKNSQLEPYLEKDQYSPAWISEGPRRSTKSPEPRNSDISLRRRANVAGIPSDHLSFFRLPSKPRPLPTTVIDRLAAQVVSHLNRTADRGMVLQKRYFQYIPSRLSQFPYLRDAVSLFCTVWANFCRRRQSLDFMNLPAYGKAIRNLRRALGTEQAFAVETLAAVTILQRTEELFNPGGKRMVHDQGMTTLLDKIGPPKAGDEFHLSVLCEDYGILVPYWMMSGWRNIMNDPAFRIPIIESMAKYTENKEIQPLVYAAFDRFEPINEAIPTLIRACESLWKDYQDESTSLSNLHLTKYFFETHELVENIMSEFLDGVMHVGEIKEEDDPESLSGTSYHFSTIYLAQIFLALTSLHICIVRMRYDWSVAWNLPEAGAVYLRLRQLSEHIWKYIKFFRSVESFVGVTSQRSLFLTVEVADMEEKEYILDLLSDMDSFRERLPAQRDALEAEIRMCARLLTGRRP